MVRQDSIALEFDDSFAMDSFHVLEMDEELLNSFLSNRKDLEFRGSDNNVAAFVTGDKTFTVQHVESSNCQIMLPSSVISKDSGKEDIKIYASFSKHLELISSPPKVYEAFHLLDKCRLGEKEALQIKKGAVSKGEGLLSRGDLQSLVRCSDTELEIALCRFGTIEINGHIRLLSSELMLSCLQFILNVLMADADSGYTEDLSLSVSAIEKAAQTYDVDIPIKVINHCLGMF